MGFLISGLDPAPFRPIYGLAPDALAARGIERHLATGMPGFPDRVELRDAAPGETLLLLNYMHQPAATPYRASHAIYVREGAESPARLENQVPEMLRVRLLSVRAFDATGRMVDADVVAGSELEALITRLFANPDAACLHAHFAKRGCYAARIDRA